MQRRVVDRHDRLPGEVLEQLLLLAREAPPAPRDRQDPRYEVFPEPGRASIGTARACEVPDARGGGAALRAVAARPDRAHPRGAPLRGRDRLLEPGIVAAPAAGPERVRVDRPRAARLGLACVDRGAHRQGDDAVAVEPHGERVADAADRRAQLAALALDLVDRRGELLGHAVELATELGELVAAGDRDRLPEVPAREAPGRHQEGVDLLCEGAADDAGRQHGQHKEGE